jgi:hypothetical protein
MRNFKYINSHTLRSKDQRAPKIVLQQVKARGKWTIRVHFWLTYYTVTIYQYLSYYIRRPSSLHKDSFYALFD